jgi:hypothetical protein
MVKQGELLDCVDVVTPLLMAFIVEHGLGQHMSQLSQNDQVKALAYMWASIWPYYAALGFTKCSLLLQYLRFFPHEAVRIACFALIGICTAFYLSATLTAVFACTPISHFWDPNSRGTCLNRTAVW